MMSSFFSTLGAVFVTLGILKIFPAILKNILSETHKHRNNKLLEVIKNVHQNQLEGVKSDLNKKLEEVKMNYQKEIENHKNDLLDLARYSEYQFKLYNELWASLYDLKYEADNLWNHASNLHMQSFALQLYETKRRVGQNTLLIRDDHYRALIDTIEAFEQFRVGKHDLISLRNRRTNITTVDREIQNLIDANRDIKNEYNILLDSLVVDFKNYVIRSSDIKDEQLEFISSRNI
ncbi:hypothetical protein [Rossellomorea sp. DA94]|uniref:hypothetical protein n=1 Tax=Rossellomorea sp. DA94 TaxID=3038653 RepID=UPI002448E066|nr:hypothetical protein [Rossellomorea sp. DA94]WGG46484.1 hypothetical protein P8596_04445 [Rossellomorea sp. DA94]